MWVPSPPAPRAAAALTAPVAPPSRVRLAASYTQLYVASVGWFHRQTVLVSPRKDLQGLAAHARWLRWVAGGGGASVAEWVAPVPDALQPTLPQRPWKWKPGS